MSIKRMLLLAGMALAAVAFVAPAVAQATVTLTEEGKALEPGDKVTATSTNLQTHTNIGTLACNQVTLHLEVVKNGESEVELTAPEEAETAEKEATTETCHLTNPLGTFVATITDWTVGPIVLDTWGHSEVGMTFISHVFGPGTCHFEGNATFQALTEPEGEGSEALGVGPMPLTPSGEACNLTEATLTAEFTLETPDSTPITIDFVHTEGR